MINLVNLPVYYLLHTSIFSRHLATRGNNNILRIPPPHISSSEERLPRLTRRILAQQTNLPSSNHAYTTSTPKHTHHHYVPSATSTHTTHIISSTGPTYAPHCHPGFVDRPRRSDCTTGQMDGAAGWWTTSGKIGHPPPLARVMGVGREQQGFQLIYLSN